MALVLGPKRFARFYSFIDFFAEICQEAFFIKTMV